MDLIGQSYISNQESIAYDLNKSLREDAINSIRSNTKFVLLTPFNLNIGEKSENVRKTKLDYHQWLDSRIKIFAKHTINSIKNQVIQFDEWGILLEYPYDISETIKVSNMAKQYDLIKPYYLTGGGHHENEIEYNIRPNKVNCEAKKSNGRAKKKYMVTTRLDSDDKLNPLYLYNLIKALYFLRKSFVLDEGSHYLFNMPCGLKERMRNDLTIVESKSHYFGDNCFTSLLTPWSSSKNIFSFPHDNIPKSFKKVDVITQNPAWTQIIHEDNIVNSW